MSTVEYDLAVYHSQLRDEDPDELVECPSCGDQVERLIEVHYWDGKKFVTDDVCADCAKEEA